ncbi:MFS transporter [Pelomonas sp. SE-A7]|uniref:MFS transporter n=1 Tax=Pelomonas sp. SE-A7 TaxID=3054953 RepID=UPI00259CB947|nr:MFS transporter [Pelomonas sp. SE-A7]MDM4766849.1 MFS transporter [Pelomonas sp. SE-A7]
MSVEQSVSPPRARGFVAAMIAMGAMAVTVFLGLPEIVGQMARQWGFSESVLGLIVFADIVGNTVGALIVAFYLGRVPVRWTLAGSVALAVLGNLLTPFAPDAAACMALRFLAGLGSGGMSGVATRYLSYTRHAERDLGLMMLGQNLWSSLLLALLLPATGQWKGATGSFQFTAAVLAVFLLLIVYFGRKEALVHQGAETRSASGLVSPAHALLALGAMLMLYLGAGMVWTFVERVGKDAGFEHGFISNSLGAANLLAMPACALAPQLMKWGGLRLWSLVLLAGCGACSVGLGWLQSPVAYAGLVAGFLVTWSAAAVLLLATIPRYDAVGRYATLGPGVLGLGFGLGALVAGVVAEHSSMPLALALAGGACGVAALLYAVLHHVPLPSVRPLNQDPRPEPVSGPHQATSP